MPPLFAAYLRVYEPLTAFGRERQLYWRRYVRQGRAVALAEGPGRQRTAVLEALGAGWSRLPELPDEAYVLETEDAPLICPWDLRLRVAQAALSARDGVPAVIADAMVPPVLAALAQEIVDEWGSGKAGTGQGMPWVHEQVSTWQAPLRWFILVAAQERELALGPDERHLRYRTEMATARRRAHRAAAVLRRSIGDAPIAIAAEEIARWLEDFHPRSVVELDYGGLVNLMGDDALREDDSPGLVTAGLAGLGAGDMETASEAYERLVARWRAVQLMERAN